MQQYIYTISCMFFLHVYYTYCLLVEMNKMACHFYLLESRM